MRKKIDVDWVGMALIAAALVWMAVVLLQPRPAHAQQSFSIVGLTSQDLLVIGAGLDKLPREDTDRNGLYQRIQAQITQQVQAAAKAKADADKAALDKAVSDALKAKDGEAKDGEAKEDQP